MLPFSSRPVYLVDLCCYRPPDELRTTKEETKNVFVKYNVSGLGAGVEGVRQYRPPLRKQGVTGGRCNGVDGWIVP